MSVSSTTADTSATNATGEKTLEAKPKLAEQKKIKDLDEYRVQFNKMMKMQAEKAKIEEQIAELKKNHGINVLETQTKQKKSEIKKIKPAVFEFTTRNLKRKRIESKDHPFYFSVREVKRKRVATAEDVLKFVKEELGEAKEQEIRKKADAFAASDPKIMKSCAVRPNKLKKKD